MLSCVFCKRYRHFFRRKKRIGTQKMPYGTVFAAFFTLPYGFWWLVSQVPLQKVAILPLGILAIFPRFLL